MNPHAEKVAALKRTDTAMWRVLAAVAVCFGLSIAVGWGWAALVGLVLVAMPLRQCKLRMPCNAGIHPGGGIAETFTDIVAPEWLMGGGS